MLQSRTFSVQWIQVDFSAKLASQTVGHRDVKLLYHETFFFNFDTN